MSQVRFRQPNRVMDKIEHTFRIETAEHHAALDVALHNFLNVGNQCGIN